MNRNNFKELTDSELFKKYEDYRLFTLKEFFSWIILLSSMQIIFIYFKKWIFVIMCIIISTNFIYSITKKHSYSKSISKEIDYRRL